MPRHLTVLHLEDNQNDSELIREILSREGITCDIHRVETRHEFLQVIGRGGVDLIISDYTLPSFNGALALALARERVPDIPYIFVSGTIGEEAAIESLKQGATDYILKTNLARLGPAVKRALRETEDRNERRLGEEKIRESESNLRAAQRITHLGSWELDLENVRDIDRNPLRWSDETYRIFGYRPGEVDCSNELFFRHVHPDDRENIRIAVGAALSGGPMYSIDHRIVLADGTEKTVHEQSEVIRDPITGKPVKMVGTVQDVTHQRKAELALRESEERFRLIAENVDDLIAVVDLQGKRIYNSPSYRKILGDPERVRGSDSFQEIHPEDRERIRKLFQETVRTGIGMRAEFRMQAADGGIRHIESQGSVVRDRNGAIIHIVVVSRDVTEQKKLEAQFLRAQRMESIGVLAGGIAHDLNNVLSPITMSIELLKKRASSESDKKLLETLHAASQRGAKIIAQVLSFARGAEGQHGDLQITHLVDEVDKILKETLPKSLTIRCQSQKGLWTIRGDATQLSQMLMNLCVNARDAMPAGGNITVATKNVQLGEKEVQARPSVKPGPFVLLTVADTGTGIPPELIEKIFDPFFTTKEEGKGTGLGLASVNTIVKGHGGFIEVQSEVGKGTMFSVYIPAVQAAEPEDTRRRPERLPSGNGELILVVDDEPGIREITKATLESYNYRVVAAGDGAEAIAVFTQHRAEIRLVITDMMMPFMDGRSTIRALQRLVPDMKFIAVSGLLELQKLADISTIAAVAFLKKPFTTATLLTTIRQQLMTL